MASLVAKSRLLKAGGKTPWLGALTALVEELGLMPNTHMVADGS